MSDFDNYSRVNKFEKRRKNTKSLSIFAVLGSILLVVLFAIVIFGGDDEKENANDNPSTESTESGSSESDSSSDEQSFSENDENNAAESDSTSDKETTSDEDTPNTEEESNAQGETDQVEPSDDNVINAYTKDWQPIGTEQTGQHTVNYNEGSQDRIEMTKAAAMATGLDEDSLIMWWIQRNGDQKVITTVSNSDNTVYYRAYLSWVDGQGWKPTKVEELKENDQEHRFE
ncbi:YrrS family protein [Virgibacillus doumboii]|uniref:YrrS family protein n=1 Tax=Virgibacillus doumboii TaxID=2697503 RepID=UPI0013E077DD|nr:YrrS family protein [Virgibacillus doumboii]